MTKHEARRELREARIKALTAMEDYINGVRNAPHTTLVRALIRARAYNTLAHEPEDSYALGLLESAPDAVTL